MSTATSSSPDVFSALGSLVAFLALIGPFGLLVVYAGAVAVVGYVAAQKGRSSLKWCVAAAFLTPLFAIVALAAIPPRAASPIPPRRASRGSEA